MEWSIMFMLVALFLQREWTLPYVHRWLQDKPLWFARFPLLLACGAVLGAFLQLTVLAGERWLW